MLFFTGGLPPAIPYFSPILFVDEVQCGKNSADNPMKNRSRAAIPKRLPRLQEFRLR